MLLQDLNELLGEYISLLERLSEEHTVNVKRIVFMINNLDHVICIFQERRVAGGKELNQVLELLMHQRELFVEEELLKGFSKMIAFVQYSWLVIKMYIDLKIRKEIKILLEDKEDMKDEEEEGQ